MADSRIDFDQITSQVNFDEKEYSEVLKKAVIASGIEKAIVNSFKINQIIEVKLNLNNFNIKAVANFSRILENTVKTMLKSENYSFLINVKRNNMVSYMIYIDYHAKS